MIEYLVLIFISLLPWIELRGSIPIGIILFNLDPISVFLVCTITNLLVFFPIHVALTHFYNYFKKYQTVEKMVLRVRTKAGPKVKKYGIIGLIPFVAVPLPVTGAWTGTLIAWLLNLDRKKSFLAIAAGVVIAGILVTLISVLAAEILFEWFGIARL